MRTPWRTIGVWCVAVGTTVCGADNGGGEGSGEGGEAGADRGSAWGEDAGGSSGTGGTGGDAATATSGSAPGAGGGDHQCPEPDPALELAACDLQSTTEAEPNDAPTDATVVCIDQPVRGQVAHTEDLDIFEFVTPDAPYGGYAIVSLTDVDLGAALGIHIRSTVDNSVIHRGDYTNTAGKSRYLWFATAPGQRYRAFVEHEWHAPGAYTMGVEWFPARDCYEPNGRDDAKWIPAGETIEAFLLAGFVDSTLDAAAFSDWYRVYLVPGAVEVVLDDVPTNASFELGLYDADGDRVATTGGRNGVDLSVEAHVPEGEYLVRVAKNHGFANEGLDLDAIPDHFAHPYSLTVIQHVN